MIKRSAHIGDWDKVSRKMPTLIAEFAKVINREGIDSALCLPDFIIAELLVKQLEALANMNKRAEAWAND